AAGRDAAGGPMNSASVIMHKMITNIQYGGSPGAASRLSPSPSRGGPGWGWCWVRLTARSTPSPPNPPLEEEGFRRALRSAVLVLFSALLSACAVGPDYKKPDLAVPA